MFLLQFSMRFSGRGSIFRSFQGWLSLSRAGAGRGALLLAPILKQADLHFDGFSMIFQPFSIIFLKTFFRFIRFSTHLLLIPEYLLSSSSHLGHRLSAFTALHARRAVVQLLRREPRQGPGPLRRVPPEAHRLLGAHSGRATRCLAK